MEIKESKNQKHKVNKNNTCNLHNENHKKKAILVQWKNYKLLIEKSKLNKHVKQTNVLK